MDFKKDFDTVPHTGLWNRMESIGVLLYFGVEMSCLFQEVRCKLKTQIGFSKDFISTMGVKQGCVLS